jgi:hypothetical protein
VRSGLSEGSDCRDESRPYDCIVACLAGVVPSGVFAGIGVVEGTMCWVFDLSESFVLRAVGRKVLVGESTLAIEPSVETFFERVTRELRTASSS